MLKKLLINIVTLICLPLIATAEEDKLNTDLNEEVVKIPMAINGFFGKSEIKLTATIYRPGGKGPFPVIVLSHGRASSQVDRQKVGRYRVIPQITEFTKRGFMVIVPVRRGYGATGGTDEENMGTCDTPYYLQAGLEAAKDILAAVQYIQNNNYADANNLLLVGQSVGGFSSLVAASLNPPGLKGVVNFSGGHGGRPNTEPGFPCSPERMTEDIAKIAKTIHVPALWHYVENDKYFSPKYVQNWFQAFQNAGAKGRLVIQPPFGKDGHTLFSSKNGIPIWTPEFDKFLSELVYSEAKR